MTASITVRFPADLLSRVREAAREGDRSLSAEIVHRVRRSFAAAPPRQAGPAAADDDPPARAGEVRR